jgi:hypothetical protein
MEDIQSDPAALSVTSSVQQQPPVINVQPDSDPAGNNSPNTDSASVTTSERLESTQPSAGPSGFQEQGAAASLATESTDHKSGLKESSSAASGQAQGTDTKAPAVGSSASASSPGPGSSAVSAGASASQNYVLPVKYFSSSKANKKFLQKNQTAVAPGNSNATSSSTKQSGAIGACHSFSFMCFRARAYSMSTLLMQCCFFDSH